MDGTTFVAFREQWLEDVQSGKPSTVELGNRFAHKLLTQWLEIDESTDDVIYCDGSGDGGIDIAFLDQANDPSDGEASGGGDAWYLVQSKYGTAFQGVTTIFDEGRKVVDTLAGHRTNLSSLASDLVQRLETFRSQQSERDRLVLVLATEEPLTTEQRRALDDVRTIGRERIGAIFDVESISIDTIYQRTLDEPPIRGGVEVRATASLTQSGHELLVGTIGLIDLYEFLRRYKQHTRDLDQLFEKNVRRFLGGRGRVNKTMAKTLEESPDQFGLFNNGITIVVKEFELEDGGVTLTDPYVVNGCQTTRTIWDVFERRLNAGGTGASSEMEAWRSRANNGAAVLKVARVGTAGEALLQQITRFTNTQNAVREKDFLALTDDFKSWAAMMADRYGVYLEIQRGGWDSQRAYQKQHPGARKFERSANAFDLVKVYGAGWLGEAGTAFGKNSAFLPDGAIFKRIMTVEPNEEPFGVDDLFAAFRLQEAAAQLGFGRGAALQSRATTKFLFYMVTIDLLKDVVVRVGATESGRHRAISSALVRLTSHESSSGSKALFGSAARLVDRYLTDGYQRSLFKEPAMSTTYGNNVNSFLKAEAFGRSDEITPNLRSLLEVAKISMGEAGDSEDSPLDRIRLAIA